MFDSAMDDFDERDETKRKSRNQSEKKRRDQFNVLLAELSSMVSPSCLESTAEGGGGGGGQNSANRKMDKTTVLLATIAFLKQQNEKKALQNASDKEEQNDAMAAASWKPSFLSDEEFVHLMLEAVDGFVLVLNVEDDGKIVYASEGVAWLLGHVPNSLLDSKTSIFDITAAEDAPVIKEAFSDRNIENMIDNGLEERSYLDLFVHFERGGASKELMSSDDRPKHELVKLTGFFAKWSCNSNPRNYHDQSDGGLGSDDDSLSVKSCTSAASRNFAMGGLSSGNLGNPTIPKEESSIVFVCSARLLAPQLVREMPVVHEQSAKSEFTSRYSLEWKFLYLDHRAPPVIGYLPFEVLGTSGYDYYHADDLDRIAMCHESLMQTGEATSCYHRFLTKGQQWIWLQTRYFITYHQWNSKPEFVVANHKVISYNDVVSHLKERNGIGEPHGGLNAGSTAGDTDASNAGDTKSATSYGCPTSPTWSSKSSLCGSSGTGMTSRLSQSSCRLSGVSDNIPNVGSLAMNNLRPEAPSSAMTNSASGDAFNFMPNNINSLDLDNAASNVMDESFDVFQTAMAAGPGGDGVVNAGGIPGPQGATGSANPLLMEAAPAMDVTGQSLRSQGGQFLTPVQLQLQQQLRAKHAELSRRIIEQQEELRRISEQLLMTQYGLMPLAVTPVAFTPASCVPGSASGARPGMMAAGPAVVAISQPPPLQPGMFSSLDGGGQTNPQGAFSQQQQQQPQQPQQSASQDSSVNSSMQRNHSRSQQLGSGNSRPR